MIFSFEQTFFYIGLSGFMAVWTFRKTVRRADKLSEFEYIGLSAFWGAGFADGGGDIGDWSG